MQLQLKVRRPERWRTAGVTARQTAAATERAARDAGGGYAEILRGTLVLSDSVVTRELFDSVTAVHRRGNADFYREEIRMAAHGVFASEGTRPHWPNITRLAVWAARRGLLPGAVFPIAQAIARRGTRAKHFLRTAARLFEHRAAEIRARLGHEIARILGGS